MRLAVMPDHRRHRGKHPEDDRLFAAKQQAALQAAADEYSWLLTRGYAEASALKLVGDRHNLTQRQRMAVWRCSCSDQARERRRAAQVSAEALPGRPLGVDGYNVLIALESALSGGVILVGRDGAHRDLASVHSTYRRVEETVPALELIFDQISACRPSRVDWYLDRPVSNSGRLKSLMGRVLQRFPQLAGLLAIELPPNPDQVLSGYDGVCASSDRVILDHCAAWIDLPGAVIAARLSHAWIVDLRRGSGITGA